MLDDCQKVEIFNLWGRVPTPVNRLAQNYTRQADLRAKFHVNRCTESPLRGKNAEFLACE